MTLCKINGCGSIVLAKGYCNRHYIRARFGKSLSDLGQTIIDRFLANVRQTDDCWIWTGSTAGRYGQFRVMGRPVPAHRFIYELLIGNVSSSSLVCHHCDNPVCVRSDHLFLGSASDNMRDMVAKGRHPKQQSKYRAKLTEKDVIGIRNSPLSHTELSKTFGVSHSLIGKIRKRSLWKNLP